MTQPRSVSGHLPAVFYVPPANRSATIFADVRSAADGCAASPGGRISKGGADPHMKKPSRIDGCHPLGELTIEGR